MGRPIKISDQNRPWYQRRSRCQERKIAIRELRQKILIVCEGERTEPAYFESFQKELPRHIVFLNICGEGCNTLSLVERAKEIKNDPRTPGYPFDQVWVVFDRDEFPLSNFDNAISSAQADSIKCAWSNEAFEIWYLLHFEYRNTPMSRADYKEKLSNYLGVTYKKNAPDMYLKLQQSGNQKQAIAWAQRLRQDFTTRQLPPSSSNPCTTVNLLVEDLNRFLTKNDL